MKYWVKESIRGVGGIAVAGIALVCLVALATFPLWLYYYNVLSFEWIVLIVLTLFLVAGGAE